ncbi:hypothetical protein GPA27_13555 [Aromatoleum toluolicum]|uniref:XRE family transcriptional regulator n=1 Tax=Aromatoleum toluolicum TaxID=90060 RepID=A0ABX1NGH9_9RHOO|nr:XRE family transcriptional regulator [Aromatoleum toluolicum]NMF98412.1 hypothetical protein [Aromatoleum toluolicum]
MTDPLQTLILRRLASVKNEEVGRAIGHDESHVSRIGRGERGLRLEELGAFLESLGLKVVEVGGDSVTIPAEKLRALKVLARDGLRHIGGDE